MTVISINIINIYLQKMRFLIHARIPTEDGNKMIQDPNFLRKIESYINKVKAEATYFFEANGNRVAAFIVDIQSADQIPVLAEPLFSGMGAHVEFHPVMSLDDLKKGIPQAMLEVNSYRY
jgi:hypothetical protein